MSIFHSVVVSEIQRAYTHTHEQTLIGQYAYIVVHTDNQIAFRFFFFQIKFGAVCVHVVLSQFIFIVGFFSPYKNGHIYETFMAGPIEEMKNYRKRPLKRRSFHEKQICFIQLNFKRGLL